MNSPLHVTNGHDLKEGGDRHGHDPKFGEDHGTATSKGHDLKDGGDRYGHDPKCLVRSSLHVHCRFSIRPSEILSMNKGAKNLADHWNIS